MRVQALILLIRNIIMLAFNPFNPHVEICPNCNWKNKFLITSDVIFTNKACPECNANTVIKPLSKLSWLEQTYLKYYNKVVLKRPL